MHVRACGQRRCKRRAHLGVAAAASLALQHTLRLPRASHHAVERGRRRRGRHNRHVCRKRQAVAAARRRNQRVQARAARRKVSVDVAIRSRLRTLPTEIERIRIPHAIQALNLPKLRCVNQLALVVVQEPARLPLAVRHVNQAIQIDVGKRPRAERASSHIPRANIKRGAVAHGVHRADVGIPRAIRIQRHVQTGAALHRARHGLANLVNAGRHGDDAAAVSRLRPGHHQVLGSVQVAARRNRKVGRQQVGRHVVHSHGCRRHRTVALWVGGAEPNRHAHGVQPAGRRIRARKDRIHRGRDRILLRNRGPSAAVVAAQLHPVNVDEDWVGHTATAQRRALANHAAGWHGDKRRRRFIHKELGTTELSAIRITTIDDELVCVAARHDWNKRRLHRPCRFVGERIVQGQRPGLNRVFKDVKGDEAIERIAKAHLAAHGLRQRPANHAVVNRVLNRTGRLRAGVWVLDVGDGDGVAVAQVARRIRRIGCGRNRLAAPNVHKGKERLGVCPRVRRKETRRHIRPIHDEVWRLDREIARRVHIRRRRLQHQRLRTGRHNRRHPVHRWRGGIGVVAAIKHV